MMMMMIYKWQGNGCKQISLVHSSFLWCTPRFCTWPINFLHISYFCAWPGKLWTFLLLLLFRFETPASSDQSWKHYSILVSFLHSSDSFQTNISMDLIYWYIAIILLNQISWMKFEIKMYVMMWKRMFTWPNVHLWKDNRSLWECSLGTECSLGRCSLGKECSLEPNSSCRRCKN